MKAPRSTLPSTLGPLLLAALVCAATPAWAQDPGGGTPTGPDAPPTVGTRVGNNVGREQMWPAPTEEDWAKPVLITFQRTWEDALAVAKEENKAILICVNMDGEIASEHYAGIRYRQPEASALYEPYVNVIASVYRHSPRDYDENGARIPCPRFGSVTCGEHIAIEPVLFEKFFDGQRVAPRHIMVELDEEKGTAETYDRYYVNDTAGVFDSIREGIATRTRKPRIIVRGDRPVLERLESADVGDREAVEAAYRDGDASVRKALLEKALRKPSEAPLDLLRLAVFGLDPDLAKLARRTLAASDSPEAMSLIVDAMRVPMEAAERDALIAALTRLGKASPRARWLAVVHTGLSGGSGTVNVREWKQAGATYAAPEAQRALEDLEEAAATTGEGEEPQDAAVLVELAESYLARAREAQNSANALLRDAKLFARLGYEDARRMALQAEERGAAGWRTDTVIALATYYGGDPEAAYPRAEAAVKALPPGEASWNSWAVLTVFAEGRWKEIKAAVAEKRDWPPQWLADLHSAYTVLREHPFGTDGQVLWHYRLLSWLGSPAQAIRVIEEGLDRFPESTTLHERYRDRLMRDSGERAVEAAYDALLAREDRPASLDAFAARATVACAESLRRRRRLDRSLEAYDRAVARWEAAIASEPDRRDEFDHGVALALAGKARVAYMRDDDDTALESILASFARRPASAGDRDGVGFTPGETGQMLLARLKSREDPAAAERLEGVMKTLDQELLRPDRP